MRTFTHIMPTKNVGSAHIHTISLHTSKHGKSLGENVPILRAKQLPPHVPQK
jgi:hypothetical protein